MTIPPDDIARLSEELRPIARVFPDGAWLSGFLAALDDAVGAAVSEEIDHHAHDLGTEEEQQS